MDNITYIIRGYSIPDRDIRHQNETIFIGNLSLDEKYDKITHLETKRLGFCRWHDKSIDDINEIKRQYEIKIKLKEFVNEL